ncbi:hypothetical protein KOM07_11020 [Lentilactobacillus sp. G22-6]|uniref:hypothetical protein n=1 Tax=Lentilactobacillus dabitei TaxID=2831523 RepID=UPI001C2790A7|nr:hypothetical protein [Lentilactobacillus dabitei]MBU9790050.1 hypothetical protein [Lentilactobacillus dabitei]
MPFFVIKTGLVLLEWKYFPTPKILDPFKLRKGLNDDPLIIEAFRFGFSLIVAIFYQRHISGD